MNLKKKRKIIDSLIIEKYLIFKIIKKLLFIDVGAVKELRFMRLIS